MSEQNIPHEQNDNSISTDNISDIEQTKEFKLNGEYVEHTKEFKIEKTGSGLAEQETGEPEESTPTEGNADSQEETVHTKYEDNAETSFNRVTESTKPQKEIFSFKKLPKSAKIAIIAAAVTVVISLVVVILVLVLKKDNIENNSIIVYRKGNDCVIRIYDKEQTVKNAQADNFKADKDSKRVYYTVPSSNDTEYFDLYYVQLAKGEISKPTLIDNAIEKNYEVIDGNVYYLKYNTETFADDGCICDMDTKEISTLSTNVNGIYSLGDTDIYFTKPDGDNLALYNCSGETVAEVSRDVTEIMCFADPKEPHIIYQTNSGEFQSASSLYIAYADKEPELICDNANMVAFDEYKPNGNLYYYTSSQESISWSYVISDQYAESDKNIKKPEKWDFLWELIGVSDGYSESLVAYTEKTARDKIREALDETVESGGLAAPVFTVFAYNGSNTVKLVEGIDPSRVYSYAAFGEPKIVYEKTIIKQGETDIATLCEMSKRSGIEEVIAYAKSIVTDCVESQGIAVAVSNGSGSLSYNLNEYDKSRTVFRFSENGESLFAVVSDIQGGKYSLYCNTFGSSGPSAGVPVSANVMSNSVAVNGEAVIYIIADTGKETGDVFSFSDGKNVKLSNAASEFVVDKSKNIFVIKNTVINDDTVKGDYYTHYNGEETKIGQNVIVSSFISRDDGSAAFIEEDKNGNSQLLIYFNGEETEVCEGATQLLLYK